MRNTRFLALVLLACGLLSLPEAAFASGGISEFSGPLEKVVGTVTGPAGKWISIVAMALCGIIFITVSYTHLDVYKRQVRRSITPLGQALT